MEKIRVAVIACGNRARNVVDHLLRDSERRVEIAAVYDPDPAEMDYVREKWETPDAVACPSAQAAIDFPGVTWVMIFSPNAMHHDHILAAFKAGKNVFSEKPLATTIGDCVEIYNAHKASGRVFATGFVLRYAQLYRQVKKLLDSGSDEYLGGIEWDVTNKVNISCGAQITRYGLSDAYMSDMSFVVNSYSAGFGVSYKASDKITLTAAYFQTNYGHYDVVSAVDANGNMTKGDSYTRTNRVLGLGCQVDF